MSLQTASRLLTERPAGRSNLDIPPPAAPRSRRKLFTEGFSFPWPEQTRGSRAAITNRLN